MLVCYFPSAVEFDKPVIFSGIDDFCIWQLAFDKYSELQDNRQCCLLFLIAINANRSGILATMTGIENDDIEFGMFLFRLCFFNRIGS